VTAAQIQDGSATKGADGPGRQATGYLAGVAAAFGGVLMILTLVFIGLTWSDAVTPLAESRGGDAVLAVTFLAYSLIGALIAIRRPENRVGWIFLAAGLTLQIAFFAYYYAFYGLISRPGSLPATELMAWASVWMPIVGLGLAFAFLLLFFPTGRLPSRRSWPVAWFVAFAIVFTGATWATVPGPLSRFDMVANPFGIATVGRLSGVGWLLTVLAVAVSAVTLIVRYVRSTGAERRQIQWFAYAAALMGLSLVASTVTNLSEWRFVGPIFDALFPLALVGLAAAAYIAIVKRDLYDIDVVISKTVTYGALAIFITALYVAIVVGIGALVGQGDEPNLVLAIGATAAVALLFEPMRSRLQRWANRLVYGERATPYEVLARFSTRAADAEHDDEMLERIPHLIVDGTGASEATLWTADGETLDPVAWWPDGDGPGDPLPPAADGRWSDPLADYSVPVEHDGELLGALSLVTSHGATITPDERELVQDLAGGLGLALRNARLTDDLRDQVKELAASRERILTAADEARRDLERDLDMGAQQELVAVKVKLGVVKARATAAEAAKTIDVLGQLEDEVGQAIESVRDFARGVYPPLLEAEGLSAALSAEAEKAALPVTIQASKVGRYLREVETAVFFSTLEALQNAAKYSEATLATVTLNDDGERLSFSVSDDGVGFDTGAVDGGSGIPGMADRLDAAGGTLQIQSAPGSGTTVSGSIPT